MDGKLRTLTDVYNSRSFASAADADGNRGRARTVSIGSSARVYVGAVCEIGEGLEGSDPSKSMRDPCSVVICRDPGWVP